MANETVAGRYAEAIFELARADGKITDVGRDLHGIHDMLESDPDIARFFYAPIIDRGEKQRVLVDVLQNKTGAIAFHSVLLLVRKRRERLLPEIVHQYDVREQQARGAEPLTITSARELSQADLASLVARLSKLYGKTFDVRQEVDPSLLGGVKIQMSDAAIDGTVEGRLEAISRTLFAPR